MGPEKKTGKAYLDWSYGIPARITTPTKIGLSGEKNPARAKPQEQCPAQAEGRGSAWPGGALERTSGTDVHDREGALRDWREYGCDELRRDRGGASHGHAARAGREDRPGSGVAEGASALSRV